MYVLWLQQMWINMNITNMNYHCVDIVDIIDKIRPGDIFAFSGNTLFSSLVKLVSNSNISHVGIALSNSIMIESTMESNSHNIGVFENTIITHLSNYDGSVWFLPLSDETHNKLNKTKFFDFINSNEHKPYDLPGAIAAVLKLNSCKEDYSKFWCSELDTAALIAGGIDLPMKPQFTLPIDLCRFDIFGNDYYQIHGTPTLIK